MFPDDCRVCQQPLHRLSRVPVCTACLAQPPAFAAQFACQQCQSPFVNAFPLDAKGLCGLCRRGLRGFDAAYCASAYEGRLRQLIHLFKYERITTLAGPLAGFLYDALPRDRQYDAIVFTPMHWRKQFLRGFNQSQLIAKELGRLSGLPVYPALRRVHAGPPQAGLTDKERRANVARAFTVTSKESERIRGKHLLAVDDVLTTGSTLAACARELKRAGAASVTAFAIARADRRDELITASRP